MKTPAWRSRLQTDAQNVTHTTRLISLLVKRTLLHVWLSLKALWQYGLLRALLYLPLLILRMLFFPLQWPLCMIGRGFASLWQWIADIPWGAPFHFARAAGRGVWNWMCDVGDRCRRQYDELRELGFVNAMALMPFLIWRLIQGAVLSIYAGIKAVVLWCGRGLAAGWAYLVAGVLWAVGCVSFGGMWRKTKDVSSVIARRAGESPAGRWTRTAIPGTAQFVRSLSSRREIAATSSTGSARSFRERTAWLIVTTAGTLGFLLMIYLQWTSASAAIDPDSLENENAAAMTSNSGNAPDEGLTRRTAFSGRQSEGDGLKRPSYEKRDAAEDAAQPTIPSGQREPSPWDEPAEADDNPFAARDDMQPKEPTTPVVPYPLDDAGDDPFAPAVPPEIPLNREPQPPAIERRPQPFDNPFDEPEEAPLVEPQEISPTPMVPPESETPELELSLDWLRMNRTDTTGEEFTIDGSPLGNHPLVDARPTEPAHDGWQLRDSPSISQQANSRLELDVPDLLVPAEAVARPLDLSGVTRDEQELNVTLERKAPEKADAHQALNYQLLVSNRGRHPVERVRVEEQLPTGYRLVNATPTGAIMNGKLVWQLDGLRPDEERMLNVEVLPTVPGVAENVTSIQPTAAVVAQTEVREEVHSAGLELDVSAPFQVKRGGNCTVQLQVANPGLQKVENVILRAVLPEGLLHRNGKNLDYRLGTMQPHATRQVELTVRAEGVGTRRLEFQLITESQTAAAAGANVEVIAGSRTTNVDHASKVKYRPPCPCGP